MGFTRTESTDVLKETLPLKETIPWYRKLSYGFGGPPLQMTTNALAFFLSIFLLETAKVPAIGLSVVQAVSRVWDGITDPIVGYIINRFNSRYGKFKPWMVIGTPMLCASFVFVFYVPNFENDNNYLKVFYYTVWNVFLQTGLTLYHVPYSAMCMALSPYFTERDNLNSIRMGFEMIGVLMGAALFGGISQQGRIKNLPITVNITDALIQKEKDFYLYGGLAVAGICFICCVIVIAGSKEVDVVNNSEESYFNSMKKIITFKPYLILMTTFMITSLGVQLIQNNLALYITHSLKLPSEVTKGIVVLLCCSLALMPVGHLLIKRFDKRKVYYAGIITCLPFLLTLPVLPERNKIFLYISLISVSFTVMVSVLLPWSMLPDVIDMFYAEKGIRLESLFYSIYVFFNKFVVGVALGVNALALQYAGYDYNRREQDDTVNKLLRYFTCASGFFCMITAVILLYFYPIDENKRKEITIQLDELKMDQYELKESTEKLTNHISVDICDNKGDEINTECEPIMKTGSCDDTNSSGCDALDSPAHSPTVDSFIKV